MTPPLPTRDAGVRHRLAAAVPEADLEAAWAAYEAAKVAGLCHEGAWEVALGTTVHRLPPNRPAVPRPPHP